MFIIPFLKKQQSLIDSSLIFFINETIVKKLAWYSHKKNKRKLIVQKFKKLKKYKGIL